MDFAAEAAALLRAALEAADPAPFVRAALRLLERPGTPGAAGAGAARGAG